jgi:hypothetical protein
MRWVVAATVNHYTLVSHLIMRTGKRIASTLLLFVIAVIFAMTCIVISKRSPVALKIGDWENGLNRFNFSSPKGIKFRLLVGIPRDVDYDISQVKGEIRVTQRGASVLNSNITTNDVLFTSWLSTKGLNGFLITGYTNNLAEEFFSIEPGVKTEISLLLSPKPPPKASVWIYCLQ